MTKLTMNTNYGVTSVSTKDNDLSLNEILPLIEQLLRGAGYTFNGNLDIIVEEQDSKNINET